MLLLLFLFSKVCIDQLTVSYAAGIFLFDDKHKYYALQVVFMGCELHCGWKCNEGGSIRDGLWHRDTLSGYCLACSDIVLCYMLTHFDFLLEYDLVLRNIEMVLGNSYVYVYFLCGLVCTCIHESNAELTCMCFSQAF